METMGKILKCPGKKFIRHPDNCVENGRDVKQRSPLLYRMMYEQFVMAHSSDVDARFFSTTFEIGFYAAKCKCCTELIFHQR